MPFRPQIECPLCQDVLEPDRSLEDHFLEGHTQRELAAFAATRYEDEEGTSAGRRPETETGSRAGTVTTDRSVSAGSTCESH